MPKIQELPPCDRFLTIACRRSQEHWNHERLSVRHWLSSESKDLSVEEIESLLEIIDTPLSADTQPFSLLHCYADVPAGFRYDILFDRDDPTAYQTTNAEVLFGVAFGRYVDTNLVSGHHLTGVLRFADGMPSMLDRLPTDVVASGSLCLCTSQDFAYVRQRLNGTFVSELESFLEDSQYPVWSSNRLAKMFTSIKGTNVRQLLHVLPVIDEQLAADGNDLTQTQANFLRDVTLHVYPQNSVTIADLSWLIFRFRNQPLPFRALMIALLLPLEELPEDVRLKVQDVLNETPGERFVR